MSSFPRNVILMFTYFAPCCAQYMPRKKSWSCLFAEVSLFFLHSQKKYLVQFGSIFNIFVFQIHFWQEKALQCYMIKSSFFSQSSFLPQVSVTSPYELAVSSCRNKRKYNFLTYTENPTTWARTSQKCVSSSSTHLSSPTRIYTRFTGLILRDLEMAFDQKK